MNTTISPVTFLPAISGLHLQKAPSQLLIRLPTNFKIGECFNPRHSGTAFLAAGRQRRVGRERRHW